MTIKELTKELEDRKVAKRAELETLIETTKLNHEITKLDSPLYIKRELSAKDNRHLDVLLAIVEEQYRNSNRKVSQTFGYGLLPNKIITLLKAIQYSKAENREDLLIQTGLDEQIVEDTLDAFGNTAYFSKVAIEVIPALPMDITRCKELLRLVAIDMKLVSELDLNKFNSANVDYQYKRAQLSAEEMLENTNEYIDTAVAYEE